MKQDDLLVGNETKMFQTPNVHRRKFLSQIGLTAVAATGLASCVKSVNSGAVKSGSVSNSTADSDVDILNYAYLLEQLEAAFYIMLTNNWYVGADIVVRRRFQQIRDHEIAHREFFKTALGDAAIATMEFDFSSIDFTDRSSVLIAAQTFEDTGVSAYNGAATGITNPDYLTVAGKIVSVEARHAAYIRDLHRDNSFADRSVVDDNGLDLTATMDEVMAKIAPYLTNGGKNLFTH